MTRASNATSAPAFVIEKGVPISVTTAIRSGLTATFLKMEINDSVFVKDGKINTISVKLTYLKKTRNRQFTLRTVEGGLRVWRIS